MLFSRVRPSGDLGATLTQALIQADGRTYSCGWGDFSQCWERAAWRPLASFVELGVVLVWFTRRDTLWPLVTKEAQQPRHISALLKAVAD